jgi:hypothetical protein
VEETPTLAEEVKNRRKFMEMYNLVKNMQHPDKLYEKEYYFDEGLGMSLNEHIEKVKKDFPDLEV